MAGINHNSPRNFIVHGEGQFTISGRLSVDQRSALVRLLAERPQYTIGRAHITPVECGIHIDRALNQAELIRMFCARHRIRIEGSIQYFTDSHVERISMAGDQLRLERSALAWKTAAFGYESPDSIVLSTPAQRSSLTVA
jgi:hypothetical protein